jgi:hypothetical protein
MNDEGVEQSVDALLLAYPTADLALRDQFEFGEYLYQVSSIQPNQTFRIAAEVTRKGLITPPTPPTPPPVDP